MKNNPPQLSSTYVATKWLYSDRNTTYCFCPDRCVHQTQILTSATALIIPPLVKFRDPVTELSCDLSVGETLGLRNTYLIKAYCDLLPILRPFLFAIKLWAKPLGLNTPSGAGPGGASFSSYALTLMTIGLFQVGTRSYLRFTLSF